MPERINWVGGMRVSVYGFFIAPEICPNPLGWLKDTFSVGMVEGHIPLGRVG